MLGSLKRRLKSRLPKPVYDVAMTGALTVYWLCKNQRTRLRPARNTPWVYAPQGFDPAREAAYIRAEFEDYLRDSKSPRDLFADKAVLEIGPGHNLGVALLLLDAGAREVVCTDRFASLLHPRDQLRIYRALEELTGTRLVGRFVFPEGDGLRFEGVRYLANVPGERLDEHVPAESTDIVLSRAVLEHVYDVPAVLAAMDRTLRPGGLMIHEIDFRDHGMFSAHGLHPLTFLTIPEFLWKRMSGRIGAPNRKLAGFFRKALQAHGHVGEYLQVLAVGGDDASRKPVPLPATDADADPAALRLVRAIRPKLAAAFRDLSDAELSVAGIFLTVRKPA